MKKLIFLIFGFLIILDCSLISFSNKNGSDHRIMLEAVKDTQARQLYINGFEKLSTREKILAYYLTQAGIAGRDIFYDQNHKHALAIRDIFEEILIHGKKIDARVYQKIRTYLHRLWINCCHYSHYSSQKFIPECTFEEFLQAAEVASQDGANFKLPPNQSLTNYLSFLKPYIFDPSFEPMLTVKNPSAGEDIITASANNFYEGVTLNEVTSWADQGLEKYPLNSKIIKENDSIVEQVYRIGLPDSGIAAGQYAAMLADVVKYLELAIPYADSVQAKIIKNMILYYQTGKSKYANYAAMGWINSNPRIDFLQGFMEVYTDPRAKKGTFENLVYFLDEERTEVMEKLVELAPYFETRTPYPDEYKKTEFKIEPTALAVLIISGTGDGGPITPAGINLPNDQYFRETFGSKNLIFTNIMGISGGNEHFWDRDFAIRFVADFFHPDDIEALKKVSGDANFAMVCLHELVGHGSGKVSPALKGDPSDYLREYYSTIEEARAELMALWNLHDPRLIHIGLVRSKDAADEIFRQWARYDLLRFSNMENRDTIEEDHDRARHLIIGYIRDYGGAIDMIKIKGKLHTTVKSIERFRKAVGELLVEIMRIKAEGDYEAAQKLVQNYGIYFNKEWRDQIVERYKRIHQQEPIIRDIGFSMPILLPVKDKKGKILDVKLKYSKDFEKEQLYYSGKLNLK